MTWPTNPTMLLFCSSVFVGDGYCDDNCNNMDNGYDGGDCCGPDVNTNYCNICQCLDDSMTPSPSPTTPYTGPTTSGISFSFALNINVCMIQ